ncbi:MAG: DarT ssDNA thymidine ADP-ribosyltransferase family protein [Xanthobacteraceae bacterium]
MSIADRHRRRYVYHFSHIDNLPSLLKTGFLANNHPKFPKNGHRSIAYREIQERRSTMKVTCGPGGCVHDYVPLYFGSLSPMLLSVINAKNIDQKEILYFEFPITLIEEPNVVFTDASANTATAPNFLFDEADLDKLDWDAIDSLKWGNVDDDFRHRRMAELLIHQNLALGAASRCVVWNEGIKKRVEQIVQKAKTEFPPIKFEDPERRHWFTDFLAGNGKGSLVIGPQEINGIYRRAVSDIKERSGTHKKTAEFETLKKLLEGLRADFSCLPHTAELIGLKSENGVHQHTVDIHTKDVVTKLLALPEYATLEDKPKRLVELAAYLHDIGKGPKSRWHKNSGVQKIDPNHPVGAMPMIVKILTKHVANVSQASAAMVAKLVCYHDLVGDVLGRGRDEQQLVDVALSKAELDMLFALGKADATSLVESWWDQDKANALYKRCLAAIEAREKEDI